MFGSLHDKRVHSVRDRAVSELRIGASIKRKLYELEQESQLEDSQSPLAGPGNSPASVRSQSPLAGPSSGSPKFSGAKPRSPLAGPSQNQFMFQDGSSITRGPIPQSPLSKESQPLSRAKTTKHSKFRGVFSFKRRSLGTSKQNRFMSVKQTNRSTSVKQKNLNRILSLKHGDLSRAASVKQGDLSRVLSLKQGGFDRVASIKQGGFNRVLSINRRQLQELTGEQLPATSEEDQFTVIIQSNEDVYRLFDPGEEARLSSVRKFRFSSRSIRNEELNDWIEQDDKKVFDGYLTLEEQYALRKKLFYKGEYMVLNYALLLMIGVVVFSIVFVSCWHTLNGPDAGLFVMLGVAVVTILVVVVMVKVRLRLARRAPGGYKSDVVIANKNNAEE